MSDTYHIDFETFSEADIGDVGGARYARDPSTEVLCLAISRNGNAPLLWLPKHLYNVMPFADPLEQDEATHLLYSMVEDEEAIIKAHNAPFEFVIWNHVFTRQEGFDPLPAERFRCTAAMARRACIPHKLSTCAAYLGLDEQKNTRGMYLIRKLSIPQKPDKKHPEPWRILPSDRKDLFQEFCEYCVQDVRTEVKVDEALKLFDVGGLSSEVFTLDMHLNEEGFPINLDALRIADKMVDGAVEVLSQRFEALVGLQPTQTKALLPWMRSNGYKAADLQAATIDAELEKGGLPKVVAEALHIKRSLSFVAVKKIKSMIKLAGPDDNRVRGTLFYHGPTTGRWASKLVQQHNLKRSTKKSVAAYEDLKSDMSPDLFELIHGPILETISCCIRHFIDDGDEPLDSVDYAAIEARIVCWLAGQADALKEYEEGIDRYKKMATRIYNTSIERVDEGQRFVGKQTVLGCGFGMGASKFQGTCESYGQLIPMETCELAVSTYRQTHKKVVAFWYALERACKNAINRPGQKFTVEKIMVFCGTVAKKKFLFLKLPSGRHLSYPDVRIDDDRITFYGQLPNSQVWGRLDTYGGKLVENVTQGVAADVMGVGALNAHRAGHKVCMLVHDEAVRITRGSGLTLDHFEKCLLKMPSWADGLPLAVDGKTIDFYRK
jgi:DNA polymerase